MFYVINFCLAVNDILCNSVVLVGKVKVKTSEGK